MRHVWLWLVIPFLIVCGLWYGIGRYSTSTLLTLLGIVLVVNAFHLWSLGDRLSAVAVFLCGASSIVLETAIRHWLFRL